MCISCMGNATLRLRTKQISYSSFWFSLLSFVCLRPVSWVPSNASISGLSIHDCAFRFL